MRTIYFYKELPTEAAQLMAMESMVVFVQEWDLNPDHLEEMIDNEEFYEDGEMVAKYL